MARVLVTFAFGLVGLSAAEQGCSGAACEAQEEDDETTLLALRASHAKACVDVSGHYWRHGLVSERVAVQQSGCTGAVVAQGGWVNIPFSVQGSTIQTVLGPWGVKNHEPPFAITWSDGITYDMVQCNTSAWTDVGTHCGLCKVRAKEMDNSDKYGGKCANYCAAQGLQCFAQQEDTADTCEVEWTGSCDIAGTQGGRSTGDLLCTCKPYR